MTEWRLAAFARWKKLSEPKWAMVSYPEIDFQDQYYYARPKSMEQNPNLWTMWIQSLLETYAKLGIPLKEQMLLAGVEGAEARRETARLRWMRCLIPFRLARRFRPSLERLG